MPSNYSVTKMKRKLVSVIILAVAMLLPLSSNAQFRRSVVAGVNINDLVFKQDLAGVSSLVGAQAGVEGELMFPGIGFGLSFGLMYNQLGGQVNLGEKKIWASEGYGNEKLYLHNITIPLHLRFKWTRLNGFEDTLAPLIFGGPDFSILAGHSKCDAIKWAGGDLGLTAGIGAEIFKKWQVTASYTWGMTYSLKTKLLDDYSARQRHWAVRVAYFF